VPGTPEVTTSKQSSRQGSGPKPTQGKILWFRIQLLKGAELLLLTVKSEYGTMSHFEKSIYKNKA